MREQTRLVEDGSRRFDRVAEGGFVPERPELLRSLRVLLQSADSLTGPCEERSVTLPEVSGAGWTSEATGLTAAHKFWFVAESEQRLRAAGLQPGACDGEDLLHGLRRDVRVRRGRVSARCEVQCDRGRAAPECSARTM